MRTDPAITGERSEERSARIAGPAQ